MKHIFDYHTLTFSATIVTPAGKSLDEDELTAMVSRMLSEWATHKLATFGDGKLELTPVPKD